MRSWPLFFATLLAVLAGGGPALARAESIAPSSQDLTSITAIRSLGAAEAARGLRVQVRGIVTRATRYELFIQDGDDAIFIWKQGTEPAFAMGDYVQVIGKSHPGHLFPVIKAEEITLIERRPLPTPRQVRVADLAAGRHDCQWVEIHGIVRSIEPRKNGDWSLRVLFDGATLRVEMSPPTTATAIATLIGARVSVKGVAGGSKTPQRQMIEPVLWVTFARDTFVIDAPGPIDPFSLPVQDAATLLEYGRGAASSEMTLVRGVVTRQVTPQLIFIRDGIRSLEVRLQQGTVVSPGDQIDAAGFAEMGAVQPILQDALIRITASGPPPLPLRVEPGRLLDYRYEADLVRVECELREISRASLGTTLVVSDGSVAFNAEFDPATTGRLPPVGSRLAIVGICTIDRLSPPDVFQVVSPVSVRLRLHSLADLTVLAEPPWWTPQRLLGAVALLSLLIAGTLAWIWTLDRRVRAQTRIILHKAQNEAMLEERNRIAREFHDTVEQQLAGATILLDAIASMAVEQPERARKDLNTARAMLRHSLEEAQQAVSDLRNNDLFEHDLKPLIEAAVRERLENTAITANFHYAGAWPDLDTVVKKHLLRIVQECVTNAIKHAAPTQIAIVMLAANDRVELQVADNGRGFDALNRAKRSPGAFGLIGLQERAEKIGARLTIESHPERGTTVALSLQRAVASS